MLGWLRTDSGSHTLAVSPGFISRACGGIALVSLSRSMTFGFVKKNRPYITYYRHGIILINMVNMWLSAVISMPFFASTRLKLAKQAPRSLGTFCMIWTSSSSVPTVRRPKAASSYSSKHRHGSTRYHRKNMKNSLSTAQKCIDYPWRFTAP